ncbi:MAG TPA: nucleoside-diphosphate kinase [bacterium]|nr:nucleoside-diphosphate kinase [bacterium]HPN42203.1 nucleoside-diphosphate kinase [bacterium]
MERTLAILKPDCLQKKLVGAVLSRIEQAGFSIIAARILHLTPTQAEAFYSVHLGKPFYPGLIEFMTQGPCMVAVLEKDNAISDYRALMGNTDPALAAPGTIRHEYATTIRYNIVHGSDSHENAGREIAFFFSESELCLTSPAAAKK